MSLLQALIIAVLQGATELFPVSSLGHAVILPPLLGWNIGNKEDFLPFLVMLHLGTAAALLLYFWRDWLGFASALLGRGQAASVRAERRTFGLVCVATAPAIVIGFALEHILRGFFGAPLLAAACLILNGFILFAGERIKHAGTQNFGRDRLVCRAVHRRGAGAGFGARHFALRCDDGRRRARGPYA